MRAMGMARVMHTDREFVYKVLETAHYLSTFGFRHNERSEVLEPRLCVKNEALQAIYEVAKWIPVREVKPQADRQSLSGRNGKERFF